MLSNERIIEAVNKTIDQLLEERSRIIEVQYEDCMVVLGVSKRQIDINVSSLKKNHILPLPMIDEELAMLKYDLRTKQYAREFNSEILKDAMIRILALYRTNKLNLDA